MPGRYRRGLVRNPDLLLLWLALLGLGLLLYFVFGWLTGLPNPIPSF